MASALFDSRGGARPTFGQSQSRATCGVVEPPMARRLDPADRRRILIADDSHDTADSLALLLRSFGHEVRVVYSGVHAISEAESWAPDVLILDIGMPGLDGYEVCRQVRKAAWGASMLVVAHTGWGKESDRRRVSEAGFDHHVVKPVDWSEQLGLLSSRRPSRASGNEA
jgi:CheY-like chemotaxis protein